MESHVTDFHVAIELFPSLAVKISGTFKPIKNCLSRQGATGTRHRPKEGLKANLVGRQNMAGKDT